MFIYWFRLSLSLQLDQVMISLEVTLRSSGTPPRPATPRPVLERSRWVQSGWRYEIHVYREKKIEKFPAPYILYETVSEGPCWALEVMDVIHFVWGSMTTGLDPCQKCVEIWPKWRFWRMKRCICHHWTPATEFYVLCAPRIRWGGVKGVVGRSWGPWEGLSSIPIQNIWGRLGNSRKRSDENSK